jgi:hypothetical protein
MTLPVVHTLLVRVKLTNSELAELTARPVLPRMLLLEKRTGKIRPKKPVPEKSTVCRAIVVGASEKMNMPEL